MSTRITQGDDNAYVVNTELSLSREQIAAVADIYNKEIQYQTVQQEIINQLADAGYDTDTIERLSTDPALVSEASSIYSDYKAQVLDSRLFNAVQSCLLNNEIIRIVQPELEAEPEPEPIPDIKSEPVQELPASDTPDEKKPRRLRAEKQPKQPKPDKHSNRNFWEDTIYD